MEKSYAINPITKDVYDVVKWEDKNEPSAIYHVQPDEFGFFECDCPARKTCRHIKLVTRYIRGDKRQFYNDEIARNNDLNK